jgi:hypothetical protein
MDEDYKDVFFYMINTINKYTDNKIRFLIIQSFLTGLEIGVSNNKIDFSKMMTILKINV